MPASHPLFWKQLAEDLVECGRIEDAGRRLEQGLALGADADLLDRLGHTHFLRGDFPEAERRFRQAAEVAPDAYGPHLNLARLALQRGRRYEALSELNLARRLAPRQRGVLYSLALLYRQIGQIAEADRVQAEITQAREAVAPRVPNAGWPRYAL
jgi:Flp pilus assembly protein TadD